MLLTQNRNILPTVSMHLPLSAPKHLAFQSPPLASVVWYYPGLHEDSCKAELRNLAHFGFHLSSNFVGYPPPQFDRLNLLGLVSGMPYLNRLCDTTTLLRLQRPSRLGLELRLISLHRCQQLYMHIRPRVQGESIPSLQLVESVPR